MKSPSVGRGHRGETLWLSQDACYRAVVAGFISLPIRDEPVGARCGSCVRDSPVMVMVQRRVRCCWPMRNGARTTDS